MSSPGVITAALAEMGQPDLPSRDFVRQACVWLGWRGSLTIKLHAQGTRAWVTGVKQDLHASDPWWRIAWKMIWTRSYAAFGYTIEESLASLVLEVAKGVA